MKTKFILFAALAILISMTACTTGKDSSASSGGDDVYFDDLGKKYDENVVEITEGDVAKVTGKNNFGKDYAQEKIVVAEDKSKITTSSDRYGNKTETRCFANHPRIDCVKITTTSDGPKESFVYPVFGGVERLPENMYDQVLTASPDEIAAAAGITRTRDDLARTADSIYSKKNGESLQPMASSQFPVYPRQMPPPLPVETPAVEESQPLPEENPATETEDQDESESKN